MQGSWVAPWCRVLRPVPDGSRVSPGSRQSGSGTPPRHTPWPAGRRCWRLRRWGRCSAPRETSRQGLERRPRPPASTMTVVRVNRRNVHDAADQRRPGRFTARFDRLERSDQIRGGLKSFLGAFGQTASDDGLDSRWNGGINSVSGGGSSRRIALSVSLAEAPANARRPASIS